MKHKAIVDCCEQLGLKVNREPADGVRKFSATFPHEARGVRVYWTASTTSGFLLGLPRVITRDGHDTHALTLREVAYLVKR